MRLGNRPLYSQLQNQKGNNGRLCDVSTRLRWGEMGGEEAMLALLLNDTAR